MLFKGEFSASIASVKTTVYLQIYSNYHCWASFELWNTRYTLKMQKWEKTKPDAVARTSFNFLAELIFLQKNLRDSGLFGTKERSDVDGILKVTTLRSDAQLLNILKYSAMEVVACVDQIICQNKRSLLDYCIFHQLHGKLSTYEEYIHLVACQSLLKANFFWPGVQFAVVEYCDSSRKLQQGHLDQIKALSIDEDTENEGTEDMDEN
jgi:hypothetical protein